MHHWAPPIAFPKKAAGGSRGPEHLRGQPQGRPWTEACRKPTRNPSLRSDWRMHCPGLGLFPPKAALKSCPPGGQLHGHFRPYLARPLNGLDPLDFFLLELLSLLPSMALFFPDFLPDRPPFFFRRLLFADLGSLLGVPDLGLSPFSPPATASVAAPALLQ